MRRSLSLIGSTGSIGTQTLEVAQALGFRVEALAARRSWERLAEQARRTRPTLAALLEEPAAKRLRQALRGSGIEVLSGMDGVCQAAALDGADLVLCALVGVAGLLPTLSALKAGKSVALANKEALVVGGELVTRAAAEHGCALLPVDSEHSAIFQCLQGQPREAVRRIILTASGGPFRTRPARELAQVTAAEALAHPTWDMGAKITIDSATLMNKGFEVLEAQHLFGLSLDQIEIWVHPQSIVHSLVELVDGSVLCQMGPPDMRTPIQVALAHPERVGPGWSRLELSHCRELTFEAPRGDDFPCLRLAFEAGRVGGTSPAVLNAANEVAVERFLRSEIGFLDIPRTIEAACSAHRPVARPQLEDLLEADRWARAFAAGVGAGKA